jgi:phosphohistidine phosphatase
MKTLLILRHAKAEAHTGPAGDHARGLNGRGQKASGDMGAYLSQHGPVPDLIICSDARRARETMDGVLVALSGNPKIELEPKLYLAVPDTILQRLRKADDRFETVMIVGHNPGLEDLARDLVAHPVAGAGASVFARMSAKFPTGALAQIGFDLDSWAFVDYGTGRLNAFIVPRDLAGR